MTVFWVDELHERYLHYDDLLRELKDRDKRHPVVYSKDPSEVLIETLLAMLGDAELTLLDPEFTDKTLRSLGYGGDDSFQTKPAPEVQIDDVEELVTSLANTADQWSMTLYTSGTTGTPSAVDQTFAGLTRTIRRGERFDGHVWGFAYNPTHFAGLQVFFQALMNRNTMVYLFEMSPDEIGRLIDSYGITHISATPTFYRLRLQQFTGVYETVERLTSGGERFEPSLRDSLHESFPNAEFRNVYAITEVGSLLESDGELFKIPEDRTEQLTISDDSELLIHESLLGEGVTDDVEGDWFHTGDIVEFVDQDHFRFLGRESDFVNVGGYRVNPHQVEQRIYSVDEIEAAVVYARESSVTGNVLVADILPADGIDEETAIAKVRETVDELERWKRPRKITVVKDIEKSRSGKRVRRDDNS